MSHPIASEAMSQGTDLARPVSADGPDALSAERLSDVIIRSLHEEETGEARRIFHWAFGTFLGLPDPMQFVPDRDFVRSRWRTEPAGALAAELDGQLVGSNFATRWGSVGFFGPLTIRPDAWDRGIARRLVAATMDLFEEWQTGHVGLFTFPNSVKHQHLYQSFGFWPRYLTPILSLTVQAGRPTVPYATYSELPDDQRNAFLKASYELTNAIYGGLDVRGEIRAVAGPPLGDTVQIWDESGLAAFAICHCGAETEAGEGNCYVKFAVARAPEAFEAMLGAVEAFAGRRGLSRVEAGVNSAREDAYRRLLAFGFRPAVIGVAMHRANDAGYSRPDAYVLDDWR